MRYEIFLQTIKEEMEKRLGPDHQVSLRSIPKNNGVIWDGLSICKAEEDIAPTIYLQDFYQELEGGQTLSQICDRIHQLYVENPGLPYLDSSALSSYQDIKDRIVYKLVNTQANSTLLKKLPHIPFHDMSMICYLLIEQREQGYVTALIHKEHLRAWKVREKDLFLTAIRNTPALLPAVIQPMSQVLKQLAQDALGDDCDEQDLDSLIQATEERRLENEPLFPTLYVLTNPAGVNGAACMAYPQVIKNFADRLGQDLLILPSSIHEVLLVTDSADYDHEEMSQMVDDINQTEVPPADRLSNQIYRYSRADEQLTIVSHGPALVGTGNR